jgi:CubicO group peptidase (beta-lactamase class C family)
MTEKQLSNEAQQRIQTVLDELVAEGNDRGVQVAVYHRGKLIVDAWAGDMDATSGRKVDGRTLFPVFSVGKGISATAVHILAGRGLLDYDKPIALDWPEFAAHGKHEITLRHTMTHTSGLQALPVYNDRRKMHDWDLMCQRMADQTPVSAPGQTFAYHAVTYAWLIGEPARRVDGRSFKQIIHDEIARPLGLEDDLFFGIGDEQQSRVATLESAVAHVMPQTQDPVIPNAIRPLEAMINDPVIQRACIPAANGLMNARAIARHYAALLPGGIDGVELLDEKTRHHASRLNFPGDHINRPITELPARRGLGYMLFGPIDDPGSAFGHDGYPGTAGFVDLKRQLTVGLAKNRTNAPRQTTNLVMEALLDALK